MHSDGSFFKMSFVVELGARAQAHFPMNEFRNTLNHTLAYHYSVRAVIQIVLQSAMFSNTTAAIIT